MRTFKEMEEAFYRDVRWELFTGLDLLTPENHRIFRFMYAGNRERPPTDKEMSKPMIKIIEDMPNRKLDWAMQQVQTTLDEKGEE